MKIKNWTYLYTLSISIKPWKFLFNILLYFQILVILIHFYFYSSLCIYHLFFLNIIFYHPFRIFSFQILLFAALLMFFNVIFQSIILYTLLASKYFKFWINQFRSKFRQTHQSFRHIRCQISLLIWQFTLSGSLFEFIGRSRIVIVTYSSFISGFDSFNF